MKAKSFLPTAIIGLAMLLSSCSAKQNAISNLRSLTYDIRDHGAEYTVRDWKEVKERFDKISNKLNTYDLTAAENDEIGRLKGQCVSYFAKGVVENVSTKVVNTAAQAKGIIEGIKEGLKNK